MHAGLHVYGKCESFKYSGCPDQNKFHFIGACVECILIGVVGYWYFSALFCLIYSASAKTRTHIYHRINISLCCLSLPLGYFYS